MPITYYKNWNLNIDELDTGYLMVATLFYGQEDPVITKAYYATMPELLAAYNALVTGQA